ncbi:MAG TPA: hydroxymethylglutaryl-CoA lyase [Bdellovibrionota bacterium]|jgi:isopropylmalate/homocitrate/citramalate synthase|nr:hydroxymethylglutaryl-CoA lyase [Bdellovibrionota bacterium]
MGKIQVFEVGPRDGLQNESTPVSLDAKIQFVNDLVECGVRDIELGAFVRADRVPQMADTDGVYAAVRSGRLRLGKTRAWALVPNEKGLDRAIEAGARNIAIFTAATDGFATHNIGMTVKESLAVYARLIPRARKARLKIRGYVSTVFGCPYEGKVAPSKALRVIEKLLDWDLEQVSVGDTIGVATPGGVDAIFKPLLKSVGKKGAPRLAGHFHDTRGTALANAIRAIDLGVTTLDSSAGGLGGCPYAPGATGNLATEDLVYMLDGMGIKTGIDLDRLAAVSWRMAKNLGKPVASRFVAAWAASKARQAASVGVDP